VTGEGGPNTITGKHDPAVAAGAGGSSDRVNRLPNPLPWVRVLFLIHSHHVDEVAARNLAVGEAASAHHQIDVVCSSKGAKLGCAHGDLDRGPWRH
jgi:hypothetical protein